MTDSAWAWELTRAARWYAGKSSVGRPGALRLLTPYADQPRVRSALLVVDVDEAEHHYHLPVVEDPLPRDATDDSSAMRAVLAALREGLQAEDLRCHPVAADSVFDNLARLEPSRHRGEQSNTSVFFGNAAMLKFFRKVEPGHNLDIEVHQALAGRAPVAEIYGWIEGAGYDLAMLCEAFADPLDGYEYACEQSEFAEHAGALGAALAQVHTALADAFPTGTISGDELAQRCLGGLDQVSRGVPELRSLRAPLAERFASVSGLELPAQRVHGDFHLGQTLLTANGWRIVDFEGEPMRPLSERRALDSPWRDVAGMTRSFAYVAAAQNASAWHNEATKAFLDSYCGVMRCDISPWLAIYELDKAVYEVAYEYANRPHLLNVPLDFINTTLKEN